MHPVYETDLIEIGESARDVTDWNTVTVNCVDVYDNINVLNLNSILRKDFVERFTDDSGNLIQYNRTEIIYTQEAKYVSMQFGESVPTTKKRYVVTLTMADITVDEYNEEDRDRMLKACVNEFNLNGYTSADGKIEMISSNAVVDRKPEVRALSEEIIYQEDFGNNQWKVAYLIW